jgi:hypothetical protein
VEAGDHAAPVGGLLVTAQYVGGGAGSLLVLGLAEHRGAPTAMAAAAVVAIVGGAMAALARGTKSTAMPFAPIARRPVRRDQPHRHI